MRSLTVWSRHGSPTSLGCFSANKRLWWRTFLCASAITVLPYYCYTNFYLLELDPSSPSFILSVGKGRLGNQMSSLATLFAFSNEYNLAPLVTKGQAQLLKNYFNISLEEEQIGLLEEELPQYKRYYWRNPFKILSRTLDRFDFDGVFESHAELLHGHTLDFGKYPNELKTYKHYLPSLKRLFKLKEVFVREADARLRQAEVTYKMQINADSSEEVVFVGVHIRLGDYMPHLKKVYGLDPVGSHYVERAMRYFEGQYKHPIFMVVSNDIASVMLENYSVCKEEPLWQSSTNSSLTVGIPPNKLMTSRCFYYGPAEAESEDYKPAIQDNIGVDLATLSRCNHSILTYGTFGMWSALLAGGRTVLPDNYTVTKEDMEIRAANMDGWVFL